MKPGGFGKSSVRSILVALPWGVRTYVLTKSSPFSRPVNSIFREGSNAVTSTSLR